MTTHEHRHRRRDVIAAWSPALLGAAAAPLVFAYAGYPAWLAARATVGGRSVRTNPDHLPTMTLLVPAHDEADVIGRRIENALALDYPQELLQIVVVDDGSVDETAAIAARYAARGVELERQSPRRGKATAINAGMRRAHGEVVVLSDASPVYAPDVLRVVGSYFADPTVGAVAGRVALVDHGIVQPAGAYRRYEDRIRRWESATGSTVSVDGNMLAFRRSLFEELPPSTINDDFLIAMRIASSGRRVVFAPEAVSYDFASSSMREEYGRRARINAGRLTAVREVVSQRDVGLASRIVAHKALRSVAPVFMGATLVASVVHGVARGASPARARGVPGIRPGRGAWLPLAAQIAIYGAAAAGEAYERRGRPVPRPLAVPHYYVASNLAAGAGLVRWARGRQPVTWEKRSVIRDVAVDGEEPVEHRGDVEVALDDASRLGGATLP